MSLRPIRILLVDDSPSDRMLTQMAFERSRVVNDLLMAEDGDSALALLREMNNLPSLILLDLNMPGMDGHEFLEVVKHDPNLRSVPVVILTSSLNEDDVARSYDNQCAGYIRKPVSLDSLIEVVASLETYWFAVVERPPIAGKGDAS